MAKFLQILSCIIMFIIISLFGMLGKKYGNQYAGTSTKDYSLSSQINDNFAQQAQNYAQNNKREMVNKFIQGVKILGLPKRIDEFTILKDVYFTEINDKFMIYYLYDLEISSNQVYLMDENFQKNMLNNLLKNTCSQASFQFFNQIENITLYYRYFLGKHELFTMTIPSGTCKNRSLAKIKFSALPK